MVNVKPKCMQHCRHLTNYILVLGICNIYLLTTLFSHVRVFDCYANINLIRSIVSRRFIYKLRPSSIYYCPQKLMYAKIKQKMDIFLWDDLK